jgi:hypothetical protein
MNRYPFLTSNIEHFGPTNLQLLGSIFSVRPKQRNKEKKKDKLNKIKAMAPT